jgi:putative phosphoribosyl transferase
MIYENRQQAGRLLADVLRTHDLEKPIVLALPRGGIPVGLEVARALGCPLDVIVARKIGAPTQPELAIGAVAEGGAVYVDRDLADEVGVTKEELEDLATRALAEVERRIDVYRGGRRLPPLRGASVILVDDGVATGATLRAAIRAVRAAHPARVIVAVPVGASDTLASLAEEVDEVICPLPRSDLFAIGQWYADFRQLTDQDVLHLLETSRTEETLPEPAGKDALTQSISIPVGGLRLPGDLTVPEGALGLVLFAHGSGSSRFSPRNRAVAKRLHEARIGTLLFDLLTTGEERHDAATGEYRFDVELLGRRLVGATDWVLAHAELAGFPIGYFGASTGAAAALIAAAQRPDDVIAVVSRGGRPDLAAPWLPRVRAPALLIVGGADVEVIQLNQAAIDLLPGEKRLEIVPGATHLFEEPGALEQVAALAAEWFGEHFRTASVAERQALHTAGH